MKLTLTQRLVSKRRTCVFSCGWHFCRNAANCLPTKRAPKFLPISSCGNKRSSPQQGSSLGRFRLKSDKSPRTAGQMAIKRAPELGTSFRFPLWLTPTNTDNLAKNPTPPRKREIWPQPVCYIAHGFWHFLAERWVQGLSHYFLRFFELGNDYCPHRRPPAQLCPNRTKSRPRFGSRSHPLRVR